MALSPDGRRLLVVGAPSGLAFRPTKADPLFYGWDDAEAGVTVWDAETGKLLSRLPTDRIVTGRPPPLFFPDGRTVLLAPGRGNELAVFDAATGGRVRALAVPKDSQPANWSGTAVSPDGRTVAAQKQGGEHVWFWDAATGAVLGSYRTAEATGRAGCRSSGSARTRSGWPSPRTGSSWCWTWRPAAGGSSSAATRRR